MTTPLEGGEWSAAHPDNTWPPRKDPVPIVQEAGWAQGPVWMGGKSRPTAPGFDPRTVQPVVSHYTDLATRPTWYCCWGTKCFILLVILQLSLQLSAWTDRLCVYMSLLPIYTSWVLPVELSVFLSNFNQILIFSKYVNMSPIPTFTQICPTGAKMMHTDRWTDGYNKV
jgi:hypothetical protein